MKILFNTIQDKSFWGCSRMEDLKSPPSPPPPPPPPQKICFKYRIKLKFSINLSYLKNIQKTCTSRNTLSHPLGSADISILSLCYIRKLKFHFNVFFLILVESLKIESLNDANKLATPDLLKIKVF